MTGWLLVTAHWVFAHPWSVVLMALGYIGLLAFVVAFIGGPMERQCGSIPEWVAEDSLMRQLPQPMDVDALLVCMMADPECVDNLIRDIFSS